MQRISLHFRSRCKPSLFGFARPEQWLGLSIVRRHRSASASTTWSRPQRHSGKTFPQKPTIESNLKPQPKVRKPPIDPKNIPDYFESEVGNWSRTQVLHQRLHSFGIPQEEIRPLLNKFVSAVQSGQLSTPEAFKRYGLSRFVQEVSEVKFLSEVDMIYSTVFFTWASEPAQEQVLAETISRSTISTIQQLVKAADRSHPAEQYPAARRMHRKVIMHVGPTNSGKTHHALQALAAAKTGIYAGPLRLLAHEIWERLNLGQIVPLGMEEGAKAAEAESTPNSVPDISGVAPVARKHGNPKYARVCNMITGEERKIVEENAPLVSCTVEMLPFGYPYDVAVIDEIQMIADENRGYGWTAAVLGVCAKEVHLCGELTAVPLIEELLKDTGDEFIVKEYTRLTPLVVEEESLEGDFSRVRKGDCIVTFRRSNIFAIKQQVEEKTGLRCAVVYGRLPPEIRSEQAALFNDPDSGYDVMIGSDAIGMGLNLKIRRVIFDAVHKWDGGFEAPLSVSQTKQIAGRAGRYGLHGNNEPGGFVTTLNAPDLPFVRSTLDIPASPLQYARIGPEKTTYFNIANALPPGSTTETIYNAHSYVIQLPPAYRYASNNALKTICWYIDTYGEGMTIADRVLHLQAPIAWRDPKSLAVVERFMQMYRNSLTVDLMKALKGTDFMGTLLHVEEKMKTDMPPSSTSKVLQTLETFHKTLVVYIWMSFRNSVAYAKQDEVVELKLRVERALGWSLRGLSRNNRIPPLRTKTSSRPQIPYATKSRRQITV